VYSQLGLVLGAGPSFLGVLMLRFASGKCRQRGAWGAGRRLEGSAATRTGCHAFTLTQGGRSTGEKQSRPNVRSSSSLPDAKRCLFCSGSWDRTIRKWDITALRFITEITGHSDPVYCLTSCGGVLFSGSRDCTVRGWSVESNDCVRVYEGHKAAVSAVVVVDPHLYVRHNSLYP
jgi:WD40 repeat protein